MKSIQRLAVVCFLVLFVLNITGCYTEEAKQAKAEKERISKLSSHEKKLEKKSEELKNLHNKITAKRKEVHNLYETLKEKVSALRSELSAIKSEKNLQTIILCKMMHA